MKCRRWLYAVSCRFPAWLKQAKFTGTLSAAISLAAFGAVQAKAAIVATTITGHVYSGTDSTGVLGFPPGTNLKGKAYTLTFYFDDTQGTQSTSGSCPPTPCGSSINNSALTGEPWPPPATAVLQIAGGAPWIFGELGASTVLSTVQRDTGSLGSSIGLALEENYAAGGGADSLNGLVTPASGTVLTTDYNWEDALYNNNLGPTQIGFGIEPVYGGVTQSANGYLNLSSITVSGPISNPSAKGNGNCGICNATSSGATASQLAGGAAVTSSNGNRAGQFVGGDPITLGTGNLFEQATDYTTAGQNPLSLSRYYNSAFVNPTSYAVTLGGKWRSNYDRYLHIVTTPSATGYVTAERPDGQQLTFTSSGTTWVTDSDVDYTLTNSGATWTLTDPDDTVETYTAPGVEATLHSIVARNGYTQTLSYHTNGTLHTVTDSYSRVLTFNYTGGLLTSVTTPETTSVQYGYTSGMLTTVIYPTSPTTTLTYLYENLSLPTALTGITDENGHRYATWAYDTTGRATSSLLGDTLNANQTTITYPTSTTATVTNAFGVVDTYTFSTIQGIPKVSGISRAATSNTAAATRSFGYDSNGYLNSATDWNGNQTTYLNNTHGDPLTINEAVGSSLARTTHIMYDTTWVHLPYTIAPTGLTTTFIYDSSGNVQTKTDTDTGTQTVPYSTSGTTRTWTNTWTTTGQLQTVTGPRTDLTQETQFGYTGGVLTSITDALSHLTTINTYTAGGLPKKITDPNSVITTLTYDGRQRLLTSVLHASAGNLTTSYVYDHAGNLTKTTLPDSSFLSNTYDNAHRLTRITNALGQYINYTLDYLGDRTAINTYTYSGTLKRQHSATFDFLGRMLTDVGGVSQTTTYAYDPMGNATSIIDPKTHTTTQMFDALNRLYQVTDRTTGVTTTAYDTKDQVTSVTDPNSHATSYIRDGFEDVIEQASPDSGTSVYTYDLADNLTQKTDGASIVTNHTYDALNRELTRTFPADSTNNIAKTYDQSGHGFGIGRVTSQTDQAGSLSNTFDERGNNTHNQRVNSGTTDDTYTSYDNASRIATYTNPSQWNVIYTRDAMGQVTAIGSNPPGVYGTPTPVISSITHLPFGPAASLSFANGVNRTAAHDLDYRETQIKDQGTGTVMKLTYTYDMNDNVHILTDAVLALNTQTLGYDHMDRLTSAVSGTGGYGTFGWTYDLNGNRKTETNGSTVTYTYVTGTNRLHSRNDSSSTGWTYNGAGENIKLYFGSYLDLTYAYDQSERI